MGVLDDFVEVGNGLVWEDVLEVRGGYLMGTRR